MTWWRMALALVVLATALVPVAPARAEYPGKPIEIVVPFVAGGCTDLVSRRVADWIGKKWKQPVVVVNKAGGGGLPGARAALKESRPDGYAILMDGDTVIVSGPGAGTVAFKVDKDGDKFAAKEIWKKSQEAGRYNTPVLHDGSIASLEELFDPARLDPEYERKGWSPPGVTKGAVPGLEFLTKLSPDDRTAVIAFLRSL